MLHLYHPELITAAIGIAAVMAIPFLQNYVSFRRRKARGERASAEKLMMGIASVIALVIGTLNIIDAFRR